VFALSCQKQKSPEIASEETRGSRELERLNACSKVNFNKNVLLYQNVMDLFVCTKWDEDFPHMYQSMHRISADSWDHIMGPIDQAFVSNQQRRDRVFKNIRELDSKGGLDDLSYVIVALNETNFFDSTRAMFTCVDNASDPVCETRKGRIPEKKSLKKIISLIDTEPETIENLSQFVKLLVKALDGHKEELRTEINKFRASPLYVPIKLQLIDAIAKKAQNGFSDEDREFVGKVLLTGNQDGNAPWIYNWIQDMKMNRDKFRDLLEYPVLTNPQFVGEIKSLELAYDGGVSCSIKSNSSPNDLIEFDFKTHISEYVSVIKNKNYKSFFDYSSADIVGLKVSTEICRELENNRYNSNFIKLITHFSDFLGEKKYYDLVKFLVSNSTAKGDPDKTFAENLYLFDLVTGDIFTSGNALNTTIISSTRGFYPLVYDVIKKFPSDGYINLGEFLTAVGKKENDPKFKGVADFWSFFSPEEKNFLFNFVDRHFDKDIDYVMLFDFYTKFLDEIKDVQPLFKDKWAGTDKNIDMSYLAMQDVLTYFAGKDTLLDFKKFFSRDQIIRVLEVISNGQSINKAANEELAYINSDNYVLNTNSEKYVFKVGVIPGLDADYDSKAVIECMKRFADIQNGFYDLVRNLPAACSQVSEANIAFRAFRWMNAVENNYLTFKKSTDPKDSLLDSKGLLSPYMLNTSLGTAKLLDNLVGSYGSSVPTKNGITYVLNAANFYLNEKGGAPVVEKNLQWLSSLLDVKPELNIPHRNALAKTFSKEDNFNYSKNFFFNVGSLLEDYGTWVNSGAWEKAKNRSLGDYEPKNDCEKVINQVVTPYPCPTKEVVKLFGNDLLALLQNVWEKEQGSPVSKILKATKTGEGIEIPLEGKNPTKYRLTLRETLRYLYDTSDKSLAVNKEKVKFTNEAGVTTNETVTTLERVEGVIREVRFDNNYLGVAFLNAIVHGNDYNEDVADRKKLLQKCVKIPGIRCGRLMSDSDLRMARNSLEFYDSLSDVNNGLKKEKSFDFGNYLKAFETSLVGSSAYEAQKAQFLPLKDELLKKHNGKILSDMTVMTSWSNAARVIRDRIGRTREDFENFINREDFKRVDRQFLYGFDLGTASPSAEKLLNKLRTIPQGETQNPFVHTVDWISSLNYNETRLLEDTVARVLVVGSYLGTPELVFNQKGYSEKYKELSSRYAQNNLFQVFLALEKVIDYWPVLKNAFPADVKLIEVVKPVNTALYFFTEKLNATTDPQRNTAYLALNDLFMALQTTLFDQLPNTDIRSNLASTQGLNLILEMFKDKRLVENTYSVARTDYKFLDVFHQNNGAFFLAAGQNLKRAASTEQIDLTPFRDYLSFTTKKTVNTIGEANGPLNYHYDEPSSLIHYLNSKTDSGISYFMLLNQKVFIENVSQISDMIDDLFPCIKIKKVKAPLALN
jgi:hypothetical protein